MDFRRFSTLPVFAVVEKRAGRQRAQPVELLDILNCTFGLLLLQPAANELQSKQRKRGGSSNATVREKKGLTGSSPPAVAAESEHTAAG